MFASLRINVPTIELVRFASIWKKTSFSKLSLCFDNTIEACAIPGGFYTTGA
jgi:hypothetical protein